MIWQCPVCELRFDIGDDQPHRSRIALGHLYWQHHQSSRKVGSVVGCSDKQVLNELRRNKIPVRSVSEGMELWYQQNVVSPETREKMRQAKLGTKQSSEAVRKMIKTKRQNGLWRKQVGM